MQEHWDYIYNLSTTDPTSTTTTPESTSKPMMDSQSEPITTASTVNQRMLEQRSLLKVLRSLHYLSPGTTRVYSP